MVSSSGLYSTSGCTTSCTAWGSFCSPHHITWATYRIVGSGGVLAWLNLAFEAWFIQWLFWGRNSSAICVRRLGHRPSCELTKAAWLTTTDATVRRA